MQKQNRKKRFGLKIILGSLFGLIAALLVISALYNLTLPQGSAVPQELSEADKARLSEIEQIKTTFGNQIMPGWGDAELGNIVFNESYAFLTGMKDPANGWVKVPQETKRGTAWETVPMDYWEGQPYYRQSLGDGITPECFAVRVGDQYAGSCQTFDFMRISMINMVRNDLPGFLKPVFPYKLMVDTFIPNADIYVSMILHENFHAYQAVWAPERFVKAEFANIRLQNSYPWEDETGIESWQNELDTLKAALQAETAEEARDLANQFLTIRAERREGMGLSAQLEQYEREREWIEGMARYAELESLRLPYENADYQPVDAIREDPSFKEYQKFETRWKRELDQMTRMADDEGDGRFYYTGMAQAYLLDRLMPDWKNQFMADPQLDFETLLRQSLEG